jgi:hypothetical protein
VVIPRGTGLLHLVSDSDTPVGDLRRLGALIRRLYVGGVALDLDDHRLDAGFHRIESHTGAKLRWTDGDAAIRLEPRPFPQRCKIEVAAIQGQMQPAVAPAAS